MSRVTIKQVRSTIKRPENQKRTIKALGLKHINDVVEHEATPQIFGMINVIKHLVEFKEI